MKANDDSSRTVLRASPESVPKVLHRGVSESDTMYLFPIGMRRTAQPPTGMQHWRAGGQHRAAALVRDDEDEQRRVWVTQHHTTILPQTSLTSDTALNTKTCSGIQEKAWHTNSTVHRCRVCQQLTLTTQCAAMHAYGRDADEP